ncbi:MAG TPA: glycosyltransferase family 4 protein [Gemmatimonadales bacterium]|nr:glycosyltransferase family 4 protein [Gemmatimonadales bacterium]
MSRICLITHVVAPWDGQGRVNYELARHLVAEGHEVTLVASTVAAPIARHQRVRWIHIPVPSVGPEPVKWLLFAAQVWLRLGQRQLAYFDIVHVHGAIAPIQADVNTSHFVHGGMQKDGPRPVNLWQRLVTAVCAWTERRAYRNARRVVAVSDGVAASLRDTGVGGRGRLRVIYNGVDPEEFRPRTQDDPRPLREGLDLPASSFLVLFVGDAVSPRKNLDLALVTLARLDPRFRLVVIGEHRGGRYRGMADRLGVGERTSFLGPRRDVAECLRDADALLCVSHYEPASLVLLEGMASGIPVICTPALGNARFVDHGVNGFQLRSAEDHERLAWLLETLERDPALGRRIGEAARATAAQLTWTRMARQYAALYRELLAELARTRFSDFALSSAGGTA